MKFVVKGSTYPSFSMIYHDGIKFTKIAAGSLARNNQQIQEFKTT